MDSGHRNIVDRHGTWSNFSGRVHAQPSRVSYPRSETELQTLVRDTRENVRAVGTGHSCTPLCATDGLLVCLDDIAGIVAISRDKQTATIRGGSKIHDLGPTLRDAGLATINQGDVDVQSIAGAVSTGTHGTGPSLGSMSTAVRSMRIVLASGDVLECSSDVEPEIFKAARVSLGAFGVISEVELQLVPAYRLHQREWKEAVSGARSFISRSNQNRHRHRRWIQTMRRDMGGPSLRHRMTHCRTSRRVKGGMPSTLAPLSRLWRTGARYTESTSQPRGRRPRSSSARYATARENLGT
ncbi:MAG: FAD-binding protein, partial [Myxococcota bacterium]